MSDEYERFEITAYDLENEFNPNRRRRITKHQAIYGIWADDDSENDSVDEAARGNKRRGLGAGNRQPKDYSAPVNFVAGGVEQAGKKKKKTKHEKPLMQSDSDDSDVVDDSDAEMPTATDDAITDEDDDDGDVDKPQHKQQQSKRAATYAQSSDDSNESEAEEELQRPASFARNDFTHKSHIQSKQNVGAWEQHTRGIGAKLLLQMGYKPGKGLGKDLQGISQPVQAHVRKGRGAIGAYGPEKKTTPGELHAARPKIVDDGDEELQTTSKDAGVKWKKGEPKNRKYRSVEEVIAKGKKSNTLLSDTLSKKLANVTVIDMTRPEKRVLHGYKALSQKQTFEEDIFAADEMHTGDATKAFELPELMHNLQLIVDMCEQDIITIDKSEREAVNRHEILTQEYDSLQEIVALEHAHINTLENALKSVEELCAGAPALTLERAEQLFQDLQQSYAAEYKEFVLGDLAAGVLAPLVKETLANWQPLAEPTLYVDLIKRWRTILDTEDVNLKRNVFDPYSSLIWAGVIPSFRTCAELWNPKQHQSMAALLDAWAPLFPEWVLDSVLEQLVLVRLVAGVRDWDPLTDVVPIHDWVLPWSAILCAKLEEQIYPVIREKLGAALVTWLPRDRSARAMLTPWKAAFNERDMRCFLAEHILPKLQMTLNELVINPLQQDLELWYQVWEWHELVPPLLMAQMLDKYFFPRWMQVLILWLNQAPDYTEISRWFSGWKSLISAEVLCEPNIKQHLQRALQIMQRATEAIANPLIAMPGAQEQAMPTIYAPTNVNLPPTPAPTMQMRFIDMQLNAPAAPSLDFKELVSQKCAERGILFAPLPGRREAGKQIYRVGKMFCYIDRKVCMISDGTLSNWSPIALAQLLERA